MKFNPKNKQIWGDAMREFIFEKLYLTYFSSALILEFRGYPGTHFAMLPTWRWVGG